MRIIWRRGTTFVGSYAYPFTNGGWIFSNMADGIKVGGTESFRETTKIFKIEELYISSKLSFLQTLKHNKLSSDIFNLICLETQNTKNNSNSFKKDIKLLEEDFGLDISVILAGPLKLKGLLKNTFYDRDGISDSIRTCLSNIKDSRLKRGLDVLLTSF
jgi:hypothetical protein